ncbi:hypothetical protein MIDIC_410003 [Alphaproteobacteria bacterium]
MVGDVEYKPHAGGKRKSVIASDTKKTYVLPKEKECEECVALYKVFQIYNCVGGAFGISAWLDVLMINAIYNKFAFNGVK